jgi:hypothetical protein
MTLVMNRGKGRWTAKRAARYRFTNESTVPVSTQRRLSAVVRMKAFDAGNI